jgi:hypothetical protein
VKQENPFITTELLERRAEQRRLLYTLPVEVVSDIFAMYMAASPDVPEDAADRALFEVLLRDWAAEQYETVRTPHEKWLLDDRLVLFSRWVELNTRTEGRQTTDPHPLHALSRRVRTERQPNEEDLGGDTWRTLRSAAFALVLADQLAGDGYEDPRIPAVKKIWDVED